WKRDDTTRSSIEIEELETVARIVHVDGGERIAGHGGTGEFVAAFGNDHYRLATARVRIDRDGSAERRIFIASEQQPAGDRIDERERCAKADEERFWRRFTRMAIDEVPLVLVARSLTRGQHDPAIVGGNGDIDDDLALAGTLEDEPILRLGIADPMVVG